MEEQKTFDFNDGTWTPEKIRAYARSKEKSGGTFIADCMTDEELQFFLEQNIALDRDIKFVLDCNIEIYSVTLLEL